jgi:serine-type D-Ala-D-Ala endopeptidase (penicillin-binding protein 7)
MLGLILRRPGDFFAWFVTPWLMVLLFFAHNAAAEPKAQLPSSDRSVADQARSLALYSNAALVRDHESGAVLYGKNIDTVHPIASLTKLMTAIVILDSGLSLDATIRVENQDIDLERGSRSKMRIGEVLARRDMLRLALMSSENRAASALARTFPAGRDAFVTAMNRRAAKLGMDNTWFVDSSGLSNKNVSTARDMAKLVAAAARYELIREYSTTPQVALTRLDSGTQINYLNTNLLLRRDNGWDINLSKTGFLNEAGYCLVLQAVIDQRTVDIILLDAYGRYSRVGDANRIKRWIEARARPIMGKL